MFIYTIINKENGKQYVGQTILKDPNIRKSKHFSDLRNNVHRNCHLQNAFNKYGENSFKFKIIDTGSDVNEINLLEKKYIKKLKTLDRNYGYNLRDGGNNGKLHEETKRKISRANSGLKRTAETKKRMSLAKQKERQNYARKGLFGFCGGYYLKKHLRPWRKVWYARIRYNGAKRSLGYFNDPLSCQIVYNLVLEEIY